MMLLFLHGAGSSPTSYHYQKSYFKGSDAVALPGHPLGKPCKTIPEYTEWLRGYIDGKGYEDVVLCGHSMGGGVTLQYALLYPEGLKGIITIGSGGRLRVHPAYLANHHDGIKDPKRWAEVIKAEPYDYDPVVRKLVVEMQVKVGPSVAYNDMTACDNFDILSRVGEIRLPALAICGTKDIMTPDNYSKYLENQLPNCKSVIIEHGTHSVMLEQPSIVNTAIEQFLSTLP